ncbi:hypothetical protein QL285_021559 [Trifolium repens]|nr:hypothetical protein QL285_021559 [Trifolium repens]
MISKYRPCWTRISSNGWMDHMSILFTFSVIPTLPLSLPFFLLSTCCQKVYISKQAWWCRDKGLLQSSNHKRKLFAEETFCLQILSRKRQILKTQYLFREQFSLLIG